MYRYTLNFFFPRLSYCLLYKVYIFCSAAASRNCVVLLGTYYNNAYLALDSSNKGTSPKPCQDTVTIEERMAAKHKIQAMLPMKYVRYCGSLSDCCCVWAQFDVLATNRWEKVIKKWFLINPVALFKEVFHEQHTLLVYLQQFLFHTFQTGPHTCQPPWQLLPNWEQSIKLALLVWNFP